MFKPNTYCNSLEQAARNIGLYVNSDKTECVYPKQNGAISTFNGKPLKLVDLFKYLGSNISSTEKWCQYTYKKSMDCY